MGLNQKDITDAFPIGGNNLVGLFCVLGQAFYFSAGKKRGGMTRPHFFPSPCIPFSSS
jgi:hypothetical protein